MKILVLSLAATAMLTGCAMSAAERSQQSAAVEREQTKLDERLAGLAPSGPPTTCIPRTNVQQTRVYNETMVFERSRNQVYVSNVGPGCGRAFDDILVFKSSNGSSYCAGDIVQTRQRTGGFFSGSCALGEFTLYTRDAG